jgi:hypothetical protein
VVEEFDGRVRLAVYRSFLDEGRAPAPPELAVAVGSSTPEVEAALRRLADQHVLVLAPGTPYVWMANPFSAITTPFRVDVGSRTWFANCIWDAFGIPAVVGQAGRITSWCGDCGERLEVEAGERSLEDIDLVAHFAVPAAHWWDDIGFN